MSSEKKGNSFEGDMNLDLDNRVLQPNFVREAWNTVVLDKKGNSMSRTKLPGTVEVPEFELSPGYTPLAQKDFGNILVVVSQNWTSTEIGTYPSPDYNGYGYGQGTTGNLKGPSKMVMRYQPLRNLYNGSIDDKKSALSMVTSQFGYSEDTELSIDIQQDYDKSLNIILTAKGHPPRIINTGFSVFPDGTCDIEDRNEGSDTNKYTIQELEEKTRLTTQTSTLPVLEFKGIREGGSLKSGNYRYYFRYMNQDGNETNIVAHSMECQVFIGNSRGKIRGGKTNEPSGKLVAFDLLDVNQSFQYISVYFTYNTGEDGSSPQHYRFKYPIRISGPVMTIHHVGHEEVEQVSNEEVGAELSSVISASASAQIDSRLVLANVSEEVKSYEDLKVFAQLFEPTIYRKQERNPGWGSAEHIYSGNLAMYEDPNYTYNFLGFKAEEIYPFGIVGITQSGAHTPVFPVKGLVFDTVDLGQYQSNPSQGYNDKGIIRFPKRENMNFTGLFYVYGVTFKLSPSAPTDLINRIKKDFMGFYFVRGEKTMGNRDILDQGIILNTISIPKFTSNPWEEPKTFIHHTLMEDGNEKGPNDFMSVPAPGYVFEMQRFERDYNNQKFHFTVPFKHSYTSYRHNDNWIDQTEVYKKPTDKRYAYYSVGSVCSFSNHRDRIRTEVGTSAYMHVKKSIEFMPAISRKGDGRYYILGEGGNWWDTQQVMTSVDNTTGNYVSLFVPNSYSSISEESYPISIDFVDMYTLQGKFGNKFKLYGYIGPYANYDTEQNNKNYKGVLTRMCGSYTFNQYVGIEVQKSMDENILYEQLPEKKSLSTAEFMGGDHVHYYSSAIYGAVVDIRRSPDIPNREQVLNRYANLDGIRYRPAEQIWRTSSLGPSYSRRVFGGDTYIGMCYRRIYFSDNYEWNVTAGPTVGMFLESYINPALRSEEQEDDPETSMTRNGVRTFMPFGAPTYDNSGATNTGKNDPWRENGDQAESGLYNRAYAPIELVLAHHAIPSNYIETSQASFQRPTRLVVSQQHVAGQFENNYRKFYGINYKDYDFKHGEIVNIFPKGNHLIVVQERGVGVLEINQRIQTGEDSGGSIYVEALDFLPPKMAIISEVVGASSKLHTIATDNFVYGVDLLKKKIWRPEGNMVNILSEGRIESYLDRTLTPDTKVVLGWDKDNAMVYFTFHNPEGPYTLLYSERRDTFVSFSNMAPRMYAYLVKSLLSFKGGKFHEHGVGAPNNIHGEQLKASIRFVVNERVDIEKVFNFFNILSNECPPSRLRFKTDKTDSTLEVGFDEFLEEVNVRWRGSKYVGKVPKNMEKDESMDWMGLEGMEKRIRGPWMEVTIEYDGPEYLSLLGFITDYTQSFT